MRLRWANAGFLREERTFLEAVSALSNADWTYVAAAAGVILADFSPTAPRRRSHLSEPRMSAVDVAHRRWILQQGAHHSRARVLPLAGATGGAGHSPLHRDGLWLLGVLATPVPGGRINDQRRLPQDPGGIDQILATTCDWKISMLGWTFTLFFLFLGFSAAIWGGWVERSGPRKAGRRGGGLLVRRPRGRRPGRHCSPALAVWLGTGVIGGTGWGWVTSRRSRRW